MKKEQIAFFTNRITQSNKSELITVLYDIFFAYLDEAKEGGSEEKNMAYRRAGQVLEHLKNALDFKYEISFHLYAIYDFCERVLAKAMYKDVDEELVAVREMMTSLSDSFKEVAKADSSGSMMQNAQEIVAGYTYGRSDVTENTANYDASRGFLA